MAVSFSEIFRQRIAWFCELPFPRKCATVLFIGLFVWWGGAKENGSRDGGQGGNRSGIIRRATAELPPVRNLPLEAGAESNLLSITAFEISQAEKTVAFETTWASNLFNYTDSGNLYLFVSTNLLEKRWMPVGTYAMPGNTNSFAFSVDAGNVDFGMRQWFLNSFDGMGFYRFGIDFDSDKDGLADSVERLYTFTDPLNPDTDGDGFLDGEEISDEINTNPLVADTDGDGVSDGDEIALGSNPCNACSDRDALSDVQEVGSMTALSGSDFMWFDVSDCADILADYTVADDDTWEVPLASHVTINNACYTNALICMNGVVYLLCPTNAGGACSSGYEYYGGLSNHQWCATSTTIALCNADLYAHTEEWGSKILCGNIESEGKTFNVVEYRNIGLYSTRASNELITCQLIIPCNETNVVYVSYLCASNTFREINLTTGIQCGGMPSLKSNEAYYNLSWPLTPDFPSEGMTIKYLIGTGTSPGKTDTDNDGLSDSDEIFVYGTNPLLRDTDDDGLIDGEELTFETNPNNADTDGDGMSDGWEIYNNINPMFADGRLDSDGDCLCNLDEYAAGSNPFAADTDGDGLTDAQELQYGTSASNPDTDDDGLSDKFEINHGYNPCNPDIDRDGLIDGWEVSNGLNPQSAVGNDGADGDPDNDGLSNIDEYQEGTNPKKLDTDGDGVSDSKEVEQNSNPTDPSDGGQPPLADIIKTIRFNINGDYATWEMTIEGLGPDDTRKRRITMARPNAPKTNDLRLRKGNSYRLSMRWLNCDGHTDDSAPWYCWQARLDEKPSQSSFDSYSNVRKEGNELIFGDGWFVENKSGLLTTHIDECTKMPDGSFGGGNVAGKLRSTLYVLNDPKLIPDYNRDGVINDSDKELAKKGKRLRFWVNDDADNMATDGRYAESPQVDIHGTIPSFWGTGGRRSDSRDSEVNGWSDLLDFTPVFMDVSGMRVLPKEVRENLAFRIRHDQGAVNVLWTQLSKSSVGEFRKTVVGSCGPDLDEDSVDAETEHARASGIEVPEKLARQMKTTSSDKGVFFIEGRSATQSPLMIDVYYDNQKIATGELPMSISSVEEMYWFYSVRGAEASQNFNLPAYYTPGNLYEDLIAKTVFFTHGFNVNAEAAHAWGSEVFKRLWQSGSNAKFKMVTWAGDFNWTGDWANGVHYHEDVYQALKSGNAYKRLVEREEPIANQRVLMAQSLGNMMTCEALRQGLTAGNYFMFNAAVASEAIDGLLQNDSDEIRRKYVPSDWDGYNPLSWAANWFRWFNNEASDSRGKMGWPNYFRSILSRVGSIRNYYSTGDSVFMESETIPDLTDGIFHWRCLGLEWPFVDLRITTEAHAWQKQETRKGIDPVAGTLAGGWGFHTWTSSFGFETFRYYSAVEANAMVATGTIRTFRCLTFPERECQIVMPRKMTSGAHLLNTSLLFLRRLGKL